MKIFLPHASENRPQAEKIQLALAGAGHEVFFDRESLPADGDYLTRIFEGAQAGCEAIVPSLRRRRANGKTGEALRATLPYVALRDAPAKQVPFGKGTLSGSAKYVAPAAQWCHEAFIASVAGSTSGGDAAAAAAIKRAVALKRDFDRLGPTHQGQPLVAVIGPPLTLSGDKLACGLTTGVWQASGQLRFTFLPHDANALGRCAAGGAQGQPRGAARHQPREVHLQVGRRARAAGNTHAQRGVQPRQGIVNGSRATRLRAQ
jgi:uncharacterized Zn-binding protein involved in type VI secretion